MGSLSSSLALWECYFYSSALSELYAEGGSLTQDWGGQILWNSSWGIHIGLIWCRGYHIHDQYTEQETSWQLLTTIWVWIFPQILERMVQQDILGLILRRSTGRWTVVQRKTKKTYSHVSEIMRKILQNRLESVGAMHQTAELSERDPRHISRTIAPKSPPTTELVAKKKIKIWINRLSFCYARPKWAIMFKFCPLFIFIVIENVSKMLEFFLVIDNFARMGHVALGFLFYDV